MILKYKIFTPEEDDFLLEIEIDENSTFLDLHYAITKACNYNQKEITSFYLSDDGWDFGVEILRTRFDNELQPETLIMEETKLNHFSPVVGQRYLFVFDEILQRGFFIEISNIKNPKKSESYPKIIVSGKAPAQYTKIEDDNAKHSKTKGHGNINDDFDMDFDDLEDFDEFDDEFNEFEDYNEYNEY